MHITQSTVQESLNLEDIEGLLEMGAPGDEYLHEAESIASALIEIDASDVTEDKLTAIIRGVWTRAFGPFSAADIEKRTKGFRQVAHELQARARVSANAPSLQSLR